MNEMTVLAIVIATFIVLPMILGYPE